MNCLYKKTRSKQAFTLVETLIGVTMMTAVLTSVFAIAFQVMHINKRNINSLQAIYLAQEAIEAVRFMRDSNILQNYAWDKNLTDGDFYLHSKECESADPCFALSQDAQSSVININGIDFTRKISISHDSENQELLEVDAKIEWTEKLILRSEELSTYLSKWQ